MSVVGSGSSPEGNAARTRKRNRISFVCQACRRSKTRCDKEKPICTRCKKLKLECVYDMAKQSAPRIPSKDATIARLGRDVDYWKNKAMKLMQEQESMPVNKDSNVSSGSLENMNSDYESDGESRESDYKRPRLDSYNIMERITMTIQLRLTCIGRIRL